MKPISILFILATTFTYFCYAAIVPASNALDSLDVLSESWSNYNYKLSMALPSPSLSNDEQLSIAGSQLKSAFDKATQDVTGTTNWTNTGIALPNIKSIVSTLQDASNNTSTVLSGVSQGLTNAGGEIRSGVKHIVARELQVIENILISIEKSVESLHPATEIGKIAIHGFEIALKVLEGALERALKKLSG